MGVKILSPLMGVKSLFTLKGVKILSTLMRVKILSILMGVKILSTLMGVKILSILMGIKILSILMGVKNLSILIELLPLINVENFTSTNQERLRAFNIFQVYKYFTIYRRYFFLKSMLMILSGRFICGVLNLGSIFSNGQLSDPCKL
jgi:hypothetical protein